MRFKTSEERQLEGLVLIFVSFVLVLITDVLREPRAKGVVIVLREVRTIPQLVVHVLRHVEMSVPWVLLACLVEHDVKLIRLLFTGSPVELIHEVTEGLCEITFAETVVLTLAEFYPFSGRVFALGFKRLNAHIYYIQCYSRH